MAEIVKVQVVADTNTAKQQLQDLQSQLQKISSTPINVNNASLVEANKAALELSQTLAKATNPNTGNLDLSIFSKELQKSGQDLQSYQNKLASIGPAGSEAFLSLSKAIATAEAPTNRLNQKLVKFGQTIKNTINWQISSSIIHSVMGQFQSAINYAEKLNTSLTNIKIVTGANSSQMADFAQQANEAARRLSTTTTAYTNASLIFFQQGLKGEDVTKRADVVIKLANVTGQATEEVSNQMTAIWNNFADGSDNLEHYADVITALGAATASSSKEIATGLEKFAAIANTVGLGYENATAALATITATTRQSADTVGTGLRTIFSRLESLKLGETLEDGVGLTKYTAALDTVGVKALDATGELRDMNDVLADLGERWTMLSRAQQMALAQTVGGVRQYATIMALMENFDKYEKNLDIAKNSDGTLQKQQEAYETGWVASTKRMRASLESIYSSLIKDDGVIALIDGFTKFLDIINDVINGLGGIQGILLMIGSIVTNKLAKDLPNIFSSLLINIKNLTGFSAKEMIKIQSANQSVLESAYTRGSNPESDVATYGLSKVNAMNQQLAFARARMTEQEINDYQTLMRSTQAYYETLKPLATNAAIAKQAAKENAAEIATNYGSTTHNREIQRITNQKRIDELEYKKNSFTPWEKLGANEQQYFGYKGDYEKAFKLNQAEEKELASLKRAQISLPKQESDVAMKNLIAIKRENEDSVLKSLALEKANLEAQNATNIARRDALNLKQKTGLSAEEEIELNKLNNDEAIKTLDATKAKIATRKQAISAEVEQDVNKASIPTMASEIAAHNGAIPASLLGARTRLEAEALEGVGVAAKKQGAWAEIGRQTKEQANIWSSENIAKMTPDQQANAKTQMVKYAEAVKQTMADNGLGNLFEGETDPIEQLKQKLESGEADLATAFQEFFKRITGSGPAGDAAAEAGQNLAKKLEQGVDTAAAEAGKVVGTNAEATDAIRTMVRDGYTAGTEGAKYQLPLHTGATGEDKTPTHQLKPSEAIAKTASIAMMLTSSLKGAENTAQTILDKESSGLDKVSSAIGTISTSAMLVGQTMSLLPGPMGIILGLALAIGTAIAGWFSGQNKAELAANKKSVQETYDNLIKKQEEFNSKHTSIDEFDELYQSYEKLAKGSEEATNAQQGLIEKAKEVADAYKDVDLYLASVSGNLEKIAEQMDQAEISALRTTKTTAESAKDLAATNLGLNLEKTVFTQKYGFGGVDKTSLLFKYASEHGLTTDAKIGYDYAQVGNSAFVINGDFLDPTSELYDPRYSVIKEDDNTGQIYVKYDDGKGGDFGVWTERTNKHVITPESLTFNNTIEDYEKALQLRDELREAYNDDLSTLAKDSGYQQLEEYLDKGKSYYDAYKEQSDLILQTETKLKILQDGIYDIKTMSEYQQARDKLIKSLAQEQGIMREDGTILEGNEEKYNALKDVVDDVLKTSRIGNTAFTFGWLDKWATQTGFNIKDVSAEYDKFISKYGKEQGNELFLKIMTKITAADGKSISEAVEEVLKEAELELKDSKLELRITVIRELKDISGKADTSTESYKSTFEKMSADDWETLATSMGVTAEGGYDNTTETGRINRKTIMQQFLAASDDQQSAWLTAAEVATINEKNATLTGRITETTARRDALLEQGNPFTDAEIEYLKARKYQNDILAKYNGEDESSITDADDLEKYLSLDNVIAENSEKIAATSSVFDIADENLESVLEWDTQLKEAEATLKDLQLDEDLLQTNGFRDALKLEAEQWGINYNEVQEYAKSLRDNGKFTQDQIEASEKFALEQKKVSAGIELVSNNLKTYQKEAKAGRKGSEEYSKSLTQIKKGLSGILGVPVSDIKDEFVEAADGAGLLTDVMNGVDGAVDKLYQYAGERDFADLFNLDLSDEILGDPAQLHDAVMAKMATMGEGVADAWQGIVDGLPKLQPGDLISGDMAAGLDSVVQAMTDTGASISKIMDFLSQQGVEAEFVPHTGEGQGQFAGTAEGVKMVDDGNGGFRPQKTAEVEFGSSESASLVTYDLVYHKKGGGGGGSGGGGGGGQKKKDHKKPNAATRYHTIKAKQSNNNQEKQETNRQKERAFGAEKIKQAEKEIELQKESIELQKQYIDEIKEYLPEDRKAMEEAFSGLGINLEIDGDNVITNFKEVEEELLRQENELIDRFNNGELSDEEYQELQKKIDEAREAMSQFEETADLLEEQELALAEQTNALKDQYLELTQMEIKIQLDVSTDRFEYLDYLLSKIDDDAYSAAEAISLLGDKTAETMKKVNTITAGLQEILAQNGISIEDLDNMSAADLEAAGFTQAQIDQIREWRSELLKANQDLLKMRDTIVNKVIDAFNELNDKIAKEVDNFDFFNSVLENYKNISNLLGNKLGPQQQAVIEKLNASMITNARNRIKATKDILNDAQVAEQKAQAQYAEAMKNWANLSDDDRRRAEEDWKKILEAAHDNVEEATQQWLEAWEGGLELAQDLFEETMEKLVTDYNKAMGGTFGNLDYLQEAYERQKDISNQYVQDYEKLYQLSQLSRDISKSIDDTDSIKSKERLRALQKEINALQMSNTKMSEYDLEVLRKRFELEQARLNLGEAKNSKSQVRLQRDSEGNWGYVYTADEDEVTKAEEEYENKLYEYQKLNHEYITQLQDDMTNLFGEYRDAIANILNDLTLSPEEVQANIEQIMGTLGDKLPYLYEQLQAGFTNQESLRQLFIDAYGNEGAQMVDTWGETILSMFSEGDSLEDFINKFRNQLQTLVTEGMTARQNLEAIQDGMNDDAEVSTTDFADHISEVTINIDSLSGDTLDTIEDLTDVLNTEFTSALAAAVEWEIAYTNNMNAMITSNEHFVSSLNVMIEKLAGVYTGNVATDAKTWFFNQGDKVDSSSLNDYDKDFQQYQEIYSKYLSSREEEIKAYQDAIAKDMRELEKSYDLGQINDSTFKEAKQQLEYEQEKLVDYWQSLLDANIQAYSHGLGNLTFETPKFDMINELEQQVTITAEFPNATNHSEIEEAFTNLINKASQYANRKGI